MKTFVSLVVAGTLGACSIFSSDESEQPAELVDFDEEFSLNRDWSVNVGDGQGSRYNRLKPVIVGDTLFAASEDGEVYAIDKASGDVLWRERTGEIITGGVGAGGNMVLLGTRDARVFALEQSTGDFLWEASVSSEVLAAPASDGRLVAVQTVDGRLIALEPSDGRQRWVYETTVPALSLRGNSQPVIVGNVVIAGFSNGMVAGVDANNGFLMWEERIAVPQGRYDIERIIDIDGDPVVVGNVVYMGSYQGNLMGLDVQSGRIVWGMPGSTYQGLALGLGNIYWVDSFSQVHAVQNNTERTVWQNDSLRLRRATAPATFNNFVAVADFEGYLHVLSQIDGSFVARTRVDRDGVRAPVVAEGRSIYVYGNSGRLSAYSLP
ncbi:outer membrane protein assembly factor BamB [Pseudohongiella acticola]|uniref:outer membrane protein assembly factor BamB n=1 Tax=Pseudohongiella acticola TaxID=1524254 RepID=UPI0014723E8E|nr:outer membrane protein assembly factor BamB [Pseudohongiella acticola]